MRIPVTRNPTREGSLNLITRAVSGRAMRKAITRENRYSCNMP